MNSTARKTLLASTALVLLMQAASPALAGFDIPAYIDADRAAMRILPESDLHGAAAPMTIDEALKRTVESDPAVQQARLAWMAAASQAESLDTLLKPTLDINGQAGYSNGSGTIQTGVRSTYQVGPQLSLELINVAKDRKHEAAQVLAAAYEMDYLAAKMDALANAARAYNSAQRSTLSAEISSKILINATDREAQAVIRARAGKAQVDVDELISRQLLAARDEASAKGQAEGALITLAGVLQQPVSSKALVEPTAVDVGDYDPQAVVRNPRVAASILRTRAKYLGILAVDAERIPTLGLVADFSWLMSVIANPVMGIALLGAKTAFSLLDPSRDPRGDQAVNEYLSAVYELDRISMKVSTDIQVNRRQLEALNVQLKFDTKRVVVARLTADRYFVNYELGRVMIKDSADMDSDAIRAAITPSIDRADIGATGRLILIGEGKLGFLGLGELNTSKQLAMVPGFEPKAVAVAVVEPTSVTLGVEVIAPAEVAAPAEAIAAPVVVAAAPTPVMTENARVDAFFANLYGTPVITAPQIAPTGPTFQMEITHAAD